MFRDIRICFIGDSFVNGTGDKEKLGWTGRLCALSETQEIEITYYNLGIRRNTSEDIRKRWSQECGLRLKGCIDTMLIFSFGVNDTVIENGQCRVDKQNTLENTRQILIAASNQYRTLMIGPPPIDDTEQNTRIKTLDSEFNSLCQNLSIPYLSVFNTLLKQPAWHEEVSKNDGAHPRTNGYSYLAKLVHSWQHWKL